MLNIYPAQKYFFQGCILSSRATYGGWYCAFEYFPPISLFSYIKSEKVEDFYSFHFWSEYVEPFFEISLNFIWW